jgi:hypothetical protein
MARRKQKSKKKPRNQAGQRNKKVHQRNTLQDTPAERVKKRLPLGTILATLIGIVGLCFTIVALYIAYAELIRPRVSIDLHPRSPLIFDSDFTFTNEGYTFRLRNAQVLTRIDRFETNNGLTIENARTQDGLSRLGNIEPKGIVTMRLPISGFHNWKKASICLLTSYHISVLGLKIHMSQDLGFLADKELRIGEWIRRPCK